MAEIRAEFGVLSRTVEILMQRTQGRGDRGRYQRGSTGFLKLFKAISAEGKNDEEISTRFHRILKKMEPHRTRYIVIFIYNATSPSA